MQLAQDVQARQRGFQIDVADDEVEPLARGERERRLRRQRDLGLPPLRRENLAQQLARGLVVVNHQDTLHQTHLGNIACHESAAERRLTLARRFNAGKGARVISASRQRRLRQRRRFRRRSRDADDVLTTLPRL